MQTMRMTSRIAAASLAVALLGGGIAYAGEGDGADHDAAETTKTTEVTDSTRPTLPEELAASLSAFRGAVREWRHCIMDVVSGDAETETCDGAPNPDDYGLSEEDLLTYDLDERIATRVQRALTRIEIRTTCIEAHAAEGRTAIYECVWTAIQAEFGDVGKHACRNPELAGSDVTLPTPESDSERDPHDV